MRDVPNHSNRLAGPGCLLLPAAALMIIAGPLLAQGPVVTPATPGARNPAPTPRRVAATQPGESRSLVVFKVEHVAASDLAKALMATVPECRIASAAGTNAVIVDGTAEDIDKVRRLAAELDKPPRDGAASPVIKAYKLANRPADGDLQKFLNEVLAPIQALNQGPRAAVATDPSRDLVIVSGDEKIHKIMEALLAHLDQKKPARSAQPATPNMKIRIVWLTDGPVDDSIPAPPPDLKDVVKELAGIGLAHLRTVTQVVIQTNTDEGFQISAPVVFLQLTRLEITGTYSDWPSDKPTLNLKIVASNLEQQDSQAPKDHTSGGSSTGGMGGGSGGMGATQREELWSIKTTMSAPVGQAVVLGVSPTGQTTSAFVVQVLE